MLTQTVIYHSPYRSEDYLDAITNYAFMGINETEAIANILYGIHSHDRAGFLQKWIEEKAYDFPFDGDVEAGVSIDNWNDFLVHYYEIMDKELRKLVTPNNVNIQQIIVSQIDQDVMVIDYVL